MNRQSGGGETWSISAPLSYRGPARRSNSATGLVNMVPCPDIDGSSGELLVPA